MADLVSVQSTCSCQHTSQSGNISSVGVGEEVVAKLSNLFLFLDFNARCNRYRRKETTHWCDCRSLSHCRCHGEDPRDNVCRGFQTIILQKNEIPLKTSF